MGFRFLNSQAEINQKACELILKATRDDELLLTTVRARWVGIQPGIEPFCDEQKQLHADLQRRARLSSSCDPDLNARILLMLPEDQVLGIANDPVQGHGIQAFLKAGADIRVRQVYPPMRIVLIKNQVLFSIATRCGEHCVVDHAVLFDTNLSDDKIVRWTRETFAELFRDARPLQLRGNRIMFRRVGVRKWFLSEFRKINWVQVTVAGLIGAGVFGTLFGLLREKFQFG